MKKTDELIEKIKEQQDIAYKSIKKPIRNTLDSIRNSLYALNELIPFLIKSIKSQEDLINELREANKIEKDLSISIARLAIEANRFKQTLKDISYFKNKIFIDTSSSDAKRIIEELDNLYEELEEKAGIENTNFYTEDDLQTELDYLIKLEEEKIKEVNNE